MFVWWKAFENIFLSLVIIELCHGNLRNYILMWVTDCSEKRNLFHAPGHKWLTLISWNDGNKTNIRIYYIHCTSFICNIKFTHSTSLAHFCPILPFYSPWKDQKTWFSNVFRGYKAVTLTINGLNQGNIRFLRIQFLFCS